MLSQKCKLQAEEWGKKWEVLETQTLQRSARSQGKQRQDQRKAEATDRTADAQQEIDQLCGLLSVSLVVDDQINWERLKDRSEFPEPKPTPLPLPSLMQEPPVPLLGYLPPEPQSTDAQYRPELGFLDRLVPSWGATLVRQKALLFAADFSDWQRLTQERKAVYEESLLKHAQSRAEALTLHRTTCEELQLLTTADLLAWEDRARLFGLGKATANALIDSKRAAYESRDSVAVHEYMDLVLSTSNYPDCFPQEFELDYQELTRTVIVDYQLPSPEDLPKLKAVKYVLSRDEFEEQFVSEAQTSKMYDDVAYQVVLRTVHELFESDTAAAIDTVVFNGIVTAVDRASGKLCTSCILSLRVSKAEYAEINLTLVDPKACFKSLKGVGSSKLHGLSPVPPIMRMSKEDSRFVSAYEVANSLDDSVNLAAMGWEDFEHLIREIFEKEFSATGGEVKVTQASRDGGVDAVAFDPDPIRGGKIIIQAKRYTNTVGVSAVRDLYGTVLAEGATKGVLVTTSDYGPDSYDFAKNRPLVLLNGANLLHMLSRHGHRARIDLREAKKMAAKA
jgi:restriction system protein